LVKPGDPVLLASTIIKALENYEESLEKARRARLYIKNNFNVDSRKRNLRTVLVKLLRRISSSENINKYYKSRVLYILLFVAFVVYIRVIKKLYDMCEVLVRLGRAL